MIPTSTSDLDALVAEVDRQTDEVRELLGSLSAEQIGWRANETRWSVGGHVAHVCIVNALYVPAMKACLARARERGLLGDGPYRHPWIASWFARNMEPPPKRRWKTMAKMVPDPEVDGADVTSEFAEIQGGLREVVVGARGVDLGRARFSSPFARMLRLSLGTGIETLLAHNRRHLWLAREVMETDGFPGGGAPAG